MSTKCRTVSGAKKWPKKSDHTYENLAYKKKDGENKLKIVIDNFDRILDEYKAPTRIPKLQKAKTCSIIESKCILKKSLSQPVPQPDKGERRLQAKTKSLAEIPQEQPRQVASSKVKEAVHRINLLNKAKSTHDVSVQEAKKVSKIPIKTPALRKTFPSTPSGLNCLDRCSGSARKNAQLSLAPVHKRDFVAGKPPKDKTVKEVVQKLEANKSRGTYRKTTKGPADVKLDLKVAQEFVECLKTTTCQNYYLDPKDFVSSEGVLPYLEKGQIGRADVRDGKTKSYEKLNYSSDDNSDDSGNISNEIELDCDDAASEKVFCNDRVESRSCPTTRFRRSIASF
jgi:hypothetical protein